MANRKPNTELVSHFNVRVPAEVYDRLREIAADERRTLSQQVRIAVEEHIADRDRDLKAAA